MYYIFVYCDLTILMPLIDRLARSRFKYCGFLITPVEIIIMHFIPLIAGLEMNKYISIVMSISCLGWFTYYYLGYLMGNKIISIHMDSKKAFLMWMISILLQFAEGWLYYALGYDNCGTQLKLTSIISGVLVALIAYNYVNYSATNKYKGLKVLKLLGDNSFGIYFSHLAVMAVIARIPAYTEYVPYPINAVIALVLTTICVLLGRRILGKYSRYFSL